MSKAINLKSFCLVIFLVISMLFSFGISNVSAEESTYDLVEIGRAVTWLNAAEINRTTNVRLSARAIDWHVMSDGDIFSFNEVVGKRTTEKGYKYATIFDGNKKIPGLGGGICQTSSTMYMAAKNAGLEIIERKPHSMPVSYVKRCDEATVSYGQIDFKFKNTAGDPIQIETYLNEKEGYLKIVIWQRVPKQ